MSLICIRVIFALIYLFEAEINTWSSIGPMAWLRFALFIWTTTESVPFVNSLDSYHFIRAECIKSASKNSAYFASQRAIYTKFGKINNFSALLYSIGCTRWCILFISTLRKITRLHFVYFVHTFLLENYVFFAANVTDPPARIVTQHCAATCCFLYLLMTYIFWTNFQEVVLSLIQ